MKYPLLVVLIIAQTLFFVPSSYVRASNLTTGLVSCWSMDEASGTRDDAYGTNDLTDNNTVLNSATAKFGSSADFERTNSEYLSITDAAQSGLEFGSGDFAIGGWIQLESNNFHTLVAKYQATNQFAFQLREFPDATDETWVDISSNGSSVTQAGQNQPGITNWSTATWYFLLYEYDASAGTVYVALNDGTAQSDAGYPTSIFDGTAAFTVGVGLLAGAEYFDGLMDEWFVYNTLLDDSQEAEIYNSGSGMSCAQILATGDATVTPYTRARGDVIFKGDVTVAP